MKSVVAWPATHPKRASIVAVIGVLLAIFSVKRLRPSGALEAMFPRDDAAAAALVRVIDHFSSVEDLLLLVSLPDEGGKPDPQKLLAFADRFQVAASGSPRMQRLCSGIHYRADAQSREFFEKVLVPAGLFYLDDESFAAAQKRLTKDEMARQFRQNESLISAPGPAAQALSKAFLQDPLRLHEFLAQRLVNSQPFKTYQNSDAFVAPDGKALLIRIGGNQAPSNLDFSQTFTETVKTLGAGVNTDHLHLDYAGSYAIAAASARSIRHDMIVGVISSVICLQLLFMIAYRRPMRFFALAFVPVAIGIVYGFGVYSLYSSTLSPMTAVIGGILAGMGIDYSIQYLSQYDGKRILSPRQAAIAAGDSVSFAMMGAWITSVFGFVAIAFSRVVALRDFSILGTLGLTGAFAAALLLLPALLVVTDRRSTPLARSEETIRFKLDPVLRWIAKAPRLLVAIGISLGLACVVSLLARGDLLPLETDLTVMHPRPNAPLAAQDDIARRFGTSPDSLIVHLTADSPAALLKLSHEVQRRLASSASQDAGVAGALGLATFLPDPRIVSARLTQTGPAVAERVERDFQAVAQGSIFNADAFAPYEQFLRHLLTQTAAPDIASLLPYRGLAELVLPTEAFESSASPPTEALTMVFFKNALESSAARAAAVASVRGELSDIPSATLTGLSVLSYDAEQTVHRDLPRLILAAVVIIAIYHFLHFRNLIDAVLSLLPTFFSLASLLAVMRLTHQHLNMVNLVAFPLLIGIDVDYGIFLVSSARRKDVRHLDRGALVGRIAPAAHAVLLCAASALFGFASLLLTSVPAIRSLGLAVSIGLIACVAGVFLPVIPALFLLSRAE